MDRVKISVVIPVYNIELYLEKCIQSVLNQSYKNLEVILIDDGSTDRGRSICQYFQSLDNRVKLLTQKNSGLSAARNSGIRAAEGDYLIFLDGDDFWLSDKVLDEIVDRISATNPDVLSFNFKKVRSNHIEESNYFKEKRKNKKTSINNNYIDNWIACAWNKAIRSELFINGELLFKKGITSEDIDWCTRLLIKADKFDYLHIPVVGYVQRFDSISNSINSSKVNQLQENILESIKLTTGEQNLDKVNCINSYLGYQVGTLLVNLGLLEPSKIENDLIEKCFPLLKYLKYSNSFSVRLIGLSTHVLGLDNTINLIRILYSVKRF